jgi:hypothetical protein
MGGLDLRKDSAIEDPVIDYKRRAAGEKDEPGEKIIAHVRESPKPEPWPAGDEGRQPAPVQLGPDFEDEDWPTEADAPTEEGQEKPARLHGPENQNPAQGNVEGRFRRLSAKFDVDSGQAIDKATNRTTDGA